MRLDHIEAKELTTTYLCQAQLARGHLELPGLFTEVNEMFSSIS
jgi:hypothetical protein